MRLTKIYFLLFLGRGIFNVNKDEHKRIDVNKASSVKISWLKSNSNSFLSHRHIRRVSCHNALDLYSTLLFYGIEWMLYGLYIACRMYDANWIQKLRKMVFDRSLLKHHRGLYSSRTENNILNRIYATRFKRRINQQHKHKM